MPHQVVASAVRAALLHPQAIEGKLSDVAIAEHVGVNDKTVAKYRAEMAAASEIPKLKERTGKNSNQLFNLNS